MTHLRIATFNTWNCQGDFDRRLGLMACGLKALHADVILLQEVFVEVPSGEDVARTLADALDMSPVYTPARKKLRSLNGAPVLSCSGLAVLTRGRVAAHHIVRLPEDPRDGERLGQIVATTINGMDVLIANVHLSHLAGEDDLRQRQLEVLMDHATAMDAHDVAMVGGDMNMTANHPAFDVLHAHHGFQRVDLDGWPATTLNPIGGGAVGMGVIDHVFVKARAAHSGRAHTALDQPDGASGCYPSDHMAVVVDIELD